MTTGANVKKLFTTVIYPHSLVILSFCYITLVITVKWQYINIIKSYRALAHGGKLKYCCNLQFFFTLESVGTVLNYSCISITLTPGVSSQLQVAIFTVNFLANFKTCFSSQRGKTWTNCKGVYNKTFFSGAVYNVL